MFQISLFYSLTHINANLKCQLKNGEALRRIQIRIFLDRVEAKLAWFITTLDFITGSSVWRSRLKGLTPSERLASVQTALQKASQNPCRNNYEKAALIELISSFEAMQIIVEAKYDIRHRGDEVAHHSLSKSQFLS
jgi:hypothetical protein